jgi:uncharacterized membrane protein YidH (DUF202 family)
VTRPRPGGWPYGDGLHNERTALSWRRTGLALLGLAAVIVRLRFAWPPVAAVLTVAVCTLAALGVLIIGVRRYHAARTNQAGSAPAVDGHLSAAVVALIVLLAAIELAGILS